ncbi:S-layer homology domain-containing protein [Paenibacillus silvisoli]|uniref:S-layer homology domain-containing protein n=1 Tax=Paenibacillus silvisoli TaxID=3110539 RepID=UPI002805CFE6|nr:S-layer homology domain-containing protein [Paenibacillus silvisoli]
MHYIKSIGPNYAGVYYLNGDKAEYVGGTLKGNRLTFTTNHFSSFAVMEYRKSFADMTGNWAADYVQKLAAKHLVNGLDEHTFGPKLAVTRADFATMAVRALGYDAEQGTASPFSDVKADAY